MPDCVVSMGVPDSLPLARNEKTGETSYKPITHIFINDQMTVWNLDIIDASGLTETQRVTDNHPYWVVGLGWVEVANLEPGMLLETEQGPGVRIVSVSDTGVVQRTYNLEVADFHTFFVGQRHVLVHNDCDLPDLNVDKARDFDQARREAFENAGLTDPSDVTITKYDPQTGTAVEFKGPGGAKVGYDGPHSSPGPHHDVQHISWQSAGKRTRGGARRGNIPYRGPRHPSRPPTKDD